MGNIVGKYDVTGQSGYPRNVVNLEEIMDVPSDNDIRTLVESARDDCLIEHRRQHLLVNCEVPALGLLSRARGVASPPAEVLLEHDAALPVSSQSAPPSARVLNVDVFLWVIVAPVCGVLGRAVFVTEGEAFLGDVGVYCRGDGSQVRIFRLQTMRLSPGVSCPLTYVSCFLECPRWCGGRG